MPLELTYLGHSGLLLSDGSHTLCVDPFLSDYPLAERKPGDIECDTLVFTHGHFDHFNDDGLSIARRTGCTVIAPFELASYIGEQDGIDGDKVKPCNPGGRVETPFGYIAFTPAIHSSSYDGKYMGVACGHVYHWGDTAIYNAGDTALFSDMKLIGEVAKPKAALLPIGGAFTMTPQLASRGAEMVGAPIAIPLHYKTMPVQVQDASDFKPQGIEVRPLNPGDSTTI